MQCPKCSQNVPDGSTACPFCGAPLVGDTGSAEDAAARLSGSGIRINMGKSRPAAPVAPSAPAAPVTPPPAPPIPAPAVSQAESPTVAPVSAPAPAPAAPAVPGRCAACGAALPAGVKFCTSCGAPASAPAAPAPTPAAAPVKPAPKKYKSTPGESYLRGVCTSSIYKGAALLYTILVVLTAVVGLISIIWAFAVGAGMVAVPLLIAGLVSAVLPILTVVGLWMLRGGAKRLGAPMPASGLTMLSVVSIIQLVGLILAAVAGVVLFIVLGVSTSIFAANNSIQVRGAANVIMPILGYSAVAVVALLGMTMVPGLVYRIKVLIMNMGASRALRQGDTPPVPSDYVSFTLVFGGVSTILMLIVYVVPIQVAIAALGVSGLTIVMIPCYLAVALGGVSNILFGALAISARKRWALELAR